jgi:hypothetical protein
MVVMRTALMLCMAAARTAMPCFMNESFVYIHIIIPYLASFGQSLDVNSSIESSRLCALVLNKEGFTLSPCPDVKNLRLLTYTATCASTNPICLFAK